MAHSVVVFLREAVPCWGNEQPLAVGKGGCGEGNDGVFCRCVLRKMRCAGMRAGRRWGELEDAFIIKVGAARVEWRGVRCAEDGDALLGE